MFDIESPLQSSFKQASEMFCSFLVFYSYQEYKPIAMLVVVDSETKLYDI